jgi:3-methylcrotonyl-CoA carboxylase alpha subunit
LAALAVLTDRVETAADDARSPWTMGDGWQLNGEAATRRRLQDGERAVEVGVRYRRGGGFRLDLPDGTVEARAQRLDHGVLAVALDGHRLRGRVVRVGAALHAFGPRGPRLLHLVDPYDGGSGDGPGAGHLTAPMPGVVIAVAVAPGDAVVRGARLMVIEAMKMEHAITAPADGTIEAVRFGVGDKVREGEEVIALTPIGTPS